MTEEGFEEAGEQGKQPSFACDICDPPKPSQQVFQCTVCLKYFCVDHLNTWSHGCYTNE